MVASFTRKWIKTWWEHRVQSIQLYQKSFIPIAMRLVEQHKAVQESRVKLGKLRLERDQVANFIAIKRHEIRLRLALRKAARQEGKELPVQPDKEQRRQERKELKEATRRKFKLMRECTDEEYRTRASTRFDMGAMIRNRRLVSRQREYAFTEHLTNPTVGPEFAQADPQENWPVDALNRLIRREDATGQDDHKAAAAASPGAANPVTIWPCPRQGCRALLNAESKCVVCETQVCAKCHAVLNGKDTEAVSADEHKCKKDDVMSLQAILKSSQACPRCRIRIYKTEGCDQMWCTQCHTAFSYETGAQIHGQIHNPHYFQQLARGEIKEDERGAGQYQHGAAFAGVEFQVGGGCGGRRTLSNTDLYRIEHGSHFPFSYIVRNWRHIAEVTLANLTNRRLFLDKSGHAPIPLAYSFVLQRITDNQWRQTIYSEQMSERFASETMQIYRTWVDAMREEWDRLAEQVHESPEGLAWIERIRYLQAVGRYYDDPVIPHELQTRLATRYETMVQLAVVCNAALHEMFKIYGKKPEYVLMQTDHTTTMYIIQLHRRVDPVKHLSPDQMTKRLQTAKRKRDQEVLQQRCKRRSRFSKPAPPVTEVAELAETEAMETEMQT